MNKEIGRIVDITLKGKSYKPDRETGGPSAYYVDTFSVTPLEDAGIIPVEIKDRPHEVILDARRIRNNILLRKKGAKLEERKTPNIQTIDLNEKRYLNKEDVYAEIKTIFIGGYDGIKIICRKRIEVSEYRKLLTSFSELIEHSDYSMENKSIDVLFSKKPINFEREIETCLVKLKSMFSCIKDVLNEPFSEDLPSIEKLLDDEDNYVDGHCWWIFRDIIKSHKQGTEFFEDIPITEFINFGAYGKTLERTADACVVTGRLLDEIRINVQKSKSKSEKQVFEEILTSLIGLLEKDIIPFYEEVTKYLLPENKARNKVSEEDIIIQHRTCVKNIQNLENNAIQKLAELYAGLENKKISTYNILNLWRLSCIFGSFYGIIAKGKSIFLWRKSVIDK